MGFDLEIHAGDETAVALDATSDVLRIMVDDSCTGFGAV